MNSGTEYRKLAAIIPKSETDMAGCIALRGAMRRLCQAVWEVAASQENPMPGSEYNPPNARQKQHPERVRDDFGYTNWRLKLWGGDGALAQTEIEPAQMLPAKYFY